MPSARSLGNATISFGLVSIPIRLFAATSPSAAISFNLLHAKCGGRVKQQYICPREDNVVVDRSDMVKGYEFAKGRFVTFTTEELEALEEKATHTIEITEFVPADKIDPVYYDKAYYLGADKGAGRAYALLAKAMRDSGRTALARYAARGKQYLVQLRTHPDGGLILQQLLYADEVRSMADVPAEETPQVKETELKLAQQIIEQISTDAFHPEKYQDDVKQRIQEQIQRKVEGEEIQISSAEPEAPQVIDLMEALKQSLAARSGKAAATPAPAHAHAGQGAAANSEKERDDVAPAAHAAAPARKPAKRAARATSGGRARSHRH